MEDKEYMCTWLVKEHDMTKEGWPVAHPRLSRRPSASTMTPWPSGKMKRSTWGLMFCLFMPAKPQAASNQINPHPLHSLTLPCTPTCKVRALPLTDQSNCLDMHNAATDGSDIHNFAQKIITKRRKSSQDKGSQEQCEKPCEREKSRHAHPAMR